MGLTNDLLERQNYTNYIKRIIDNSDTYARDEENSAFVLAIDSAWGTGKTTFIDILTNTLINSPEPYEIIKYSAWENDFWTNAFEPLANAIYTAECIGECIEDKHDKELGSEFKNKLTKAFAVLGKGFASLPLRGVLGENYSQELIDALRELLTEFVNNYCSGKLIIFVDELDRCKPTFAIQTLEYVKHIFNVPNIVFVFALDVQQLAHAVRSVYGAGIDAEAYLLRMFSLYSRMPIGSIENYLNSRILDVDLNSKTSEATLKVLKRYLYNHSLSLREINTLLKAIKILDETLLTKYNNSSALELYIKMLLLKYKYPTVFGELPQYDEEKKDIVSFFNLRSNIFSYKSLEEYFAKGVDIEIKNLSEFSFTGIPQINLDAMIRVDSVKVVVGNRISFQQGDTILYTGEMSEDFNINGLLFKRDLQDWDNIKKLSFPVFIKKQLETASFMNQIFVQSGFLSTSEVALSVKMRDMES